MTIAAKSGYIHVLFLIVIFVFAAACGKKNVKPAAVVEPGQYTQTAAEPAFTTEDMTAPDSEGSLRNKKYTLESGVYTIYFDFDRSELSDEARKSLRENAAALKKRAAVEIQVAGHCDERGTTEYNLALGQHRANAVRNYYKHQGIKMSRMSTISFGEEKPVCTGSNDECWAQNRRVETLVVAK